MIAIRRILCMVWALGTLSALLMGQPTNDSCENADTVFLDVPVDFSTINATDSGPFHPGAPCPSSASDSIFSDIWYVHTATITGELEWTLCGMADFDSRIAVYQAGATCPLSDDDLLACNEDGHAGCTNFESEVFFDAVAGETYVLRLGGFGEQTPGAQGSGSFVVTEAPPRPDNDDCMDAQVITLGFDHPISNINATTDGPAHPNDQICFGFGDINAQVDVWFRFVAPNTATVEWSTCGQVSFDSRLVVYGPNVECLPTPDDMLACSDATGGCPDYTNILPFNVEAGQEYLLRVGGFGTAMGSGVFDLIEIATPTPPSNDQCADADSVYLITPEAADNNEDGIEGTTVSATLTPGLFPACTGNPTGEYPDVWYRFNTEGRTEIEVRFIALNPESGFFYEFMTDCSGDTLDQSYCFFLDPEAGTSRRDTITGLPSESTWLYLRVSSWIFWPSGGFVCQLVAEEPSGIRDLPFPGDIRIFPNPATHVLTLDASVEAEQAFVQLYNGLGHNIGLPLALRRGDTVMEIDLRSLPRGLYYLVIEADRGREVQKFAKL